MTDHAAKLRPILMDVASDQDLPQTARLAAADAEGAVDIEAVIARAGAAIVALESVGDVIEARAKALRAALLDVMVETGAPPISTGSHTVGVSETARVRITDPDAVPEAFLVAVKPKPDTQAIGAALRAGQQIPGCHLSNGEPSLFVRARRA